MFGFVVQYGYQRLEIRVYGSRFLAFNTLLHTKSEQKVIVIKFVHQWSLKLEIYFYTLCRACLDCIGYFLFEKQTSNGLLKVIGIQKISWRLN